MQLSAEVTALGRSLEATLESGNVWSAQQLKQLSSCRTTTVVDLFRQLLLRVRLRKANARGRNVLDLVSIATRSFRNIPTQNTATVGETVTLLQDQFFHVTERAPEWVRRRLAHIYQVQVQPECLRGYMQGDPASWRRGLMSSFFGMTFIPGQHRLSSSEGAAFVPIDDPACLTLNVRPHVFPNSQVGGMFDIKVHCFRIDPDSGVVFVGGSGDQQGDTAYSRTVLAKHFNYTPYTGDSPQILSADDADVIEGGLALHAAMERAVLFEGLQKTLCFPDVYLGFRRLNDLDHEPAKGLQLGVLKEIEAWFACGRPAEWPSLPSLRNYFDYLWKPQSWPDVVRQIGEEASQYLCREYRDEAIVEFHDPDPAFGDLSLVPLKSFEPNSPQKPIRRAAKVFLRFSNDLMGSAGCVASPLLAKQFASRTLDKDRAKGFAKAQVVRFSKFDDLVGYADGFDFDFSGVPAGQEEAFQIAGL